MSNSCEGTLRVVSKNHDTIDRLMKILKYEDSEFCLYRCKYAEIANEDTDGDFFIADISVDGAWDCSPFFNHGDHPETLLAVGYEKDENGKTDWEKPIYGTAHSTDLVHLAKTLDFGCELFAKEGGCEFCQHLSIDHTGEDYFEEHGHYECWNDKKTDEFMEEFGIEGFDDFMENKCIYG